MRERHMCTSCLSIHDNIHIHIYKIELDECLAPCRQQTNYKPHVYVHINCSITLFLLINIIFIIIDIYEPIHKVKPLLRTCVDVEHICVFVDIVYKYYI